MVPASHRMRRAEDFATAIRRGRRSGSSTVVAHLAVVGDEKHRDVPVRVGFVVNKAVGGAVTRNTVRRRLRHLIRDRLDRLAVSISESSSGGGLLVIRALPASAEASSDRLADDLDAVLASVLRPKRQAPEMSAV